MLTLYIIMLSVFYGYLGFIFSKYGILPSISESFYRLPKKLNFIFTLVMWGFAFPSMILGVEITGLLFLASFGIMLVGAANAFKDKFVKPIHYAGAFVGILASQISILFVMKYLYITLITTILCILLFLFRNKINNTHLLWIEIISFTALSVSYGMYYF